MRMVTALLLLAGCADSEVEKAERAVVLAEASDDYDEKCAAYTRLKGAYQTEGNVKGYRSAIISADAACLIAGDPDLRAAGGDPVAQAADNIEAVAEDAAAQ